MCQASLECDMFNDVIVRLIDGVMGLECENDVKVKILKDITELTNGVAELCELYCDVVKRYVAVCPEA